MHFFPSSPVFSSHFARFASLQRHPDRVRRNWVYFAMNVIADTSWFLSLCAWNDQNHCKINEELSFLFVVFSHHIFQFSDVELRTKWRKSTAYAMCSVLDAGSELFFCEFAFFVATDDAKAMVNWNEMKNATSSPVVFSVWPRHTKMRKIK